MKTKIRNCVVRHIETMVPSKIVNNIDLNFEDKVKKKIIKATGVIQRHILNDDESLVPLFREVGNNALKKLGWDKDSIDGIIVVSQSPEYKLPSNSCILQGELNLNNNCFSYDISFGCSGYIYGLFNAMSNIAASNGEIKRVLLFVGDALSTISHPKNQKNVFINGDAVSCTAIEYDINACETPFILKTDGKEFDNIILYDGGLKNRMSKESFEEYIDEEGDLNSKASLFMKGAKVFNFTVDNVPNIVEETLQYANINKDQITNFLFHQANKFMVDFLSTKIGVQDKSPINIEKFGNTSCASIPLLITDFKPSTKSNMLVGFGVGMSMGTCIVDLEKTTFNHGVYNDKI